MLHHPAIEPTIQALGWAVLHFAWQGAVIGLLAAAALVTLRGASPATRYAVSCAALACCVLAFALTLGLLLGTHAGALAHAAPPPLSTAPQPPLGESIAAAPILPNVIDSLAWLWAGGVLLFAVRVLVQGLAARRLRTSQVWPADPAWQQVFESLAHDLRVSRGVRLLRSGLAHTPMVVGWFAPAVLIPASAFTSLTHDQLRAVLIHELSHIRRLDHLANAAQVLAEVLLFFHPAVWWLSSRIRLERENCCDDDAIRRAPSPQVLAQALARLESLRHEFPQAALAATGGPLMNRITRVLRANPTTNAAPRWRTVAAIVAGMAIAATGIAHATASIRLAEDDPILEALRESAQAGGSTTELRQLYQTLVYPGSEAQRAAEAELAELQSRIRRAVESGRLSPTDAEAKLDQVRRDLDARIGMTFAMDVLGMTEGEAKLTLARERLHSLVLSGELTDADAALKLAELEGTIDLREEYAARLTQHTAEIRRQVEAGRISAEEGRTRIESLEVELKQRLEYRALAEQLMAKVEAGGITREQAEARLAGLKEQMAASNPPRETDWDAITQRIEGAVQTGRLTRQQADEAYAALKERMAARSSAGPTLQWEAIQRRIESAVENGHMTREQAERAYAELKQRMAAESGQDAGPAAPDELWSRVARALHEQGIPRESLGDVMGTLKRIVAEIKAEGDRFELDPDTRAELQRQGLTEDQIRHAVGLAQRIAAAQR